MSVHAVYRSLLYTHTVGTHTPAQARTRMHTYAHYFPYGTSVSVANPVCLVPVLMALVFSRRENIDFDLNYMFGTSIEHTNQLGLDSVSVTKMFLLPSLHVIAI